MHRWLLLFSLCYAQQLIQPQLQYFKDFVFTAADTLRGALRPERTCYDVTFYDFHVKILIEQDSIIGNNHIYFILKEPTKRIQIDLFKNLKIDSILFEGQQLHYERIHNAVFIDFPKRLIDTGAVYKLSVYYRGRPREAPLPPWQGGFVREKDRNGNPWWSVACEGYGASSWWPLKDHLSDEPDSMRIRITVPKNLQAISNGELLSIEYDETNQWATYEWYVTYPINSYNVTFYIGDYYHFQDHYTSTLGIGLLQLDFYVLRYNAIKAREHFQQVKPMLQCFEQLIGPYPFWVDGYALVEAPYWGMEHQGAIAYGNHYKNNRWGFDYIIVHESGHEWFGNYISAADHAELWIHESFTTYLEILFVECRYGKEKAQVYLNTYRDRIRNQLPILAPLNVNFDRWPDSDMYYKGAWMFHTLRSCLNNDSLWFAWFKALYDDFGLKTIHSDDIVKHFNQFTQQDYTAFFRQYLCHPKPPRLYYRVKKKKGGCLLWVRWETEEKPFSMPVEFIINNKGKRVRLVVTDQWQQHWIENASAEMLHPDTDKFYILSNRVTSLK